MEGETLVLNADLAQKVQQRVQSGRFGSPDDVVAAALHALELQESDDTEKVIALSQAIDDGLASGIAEPGAFARVRARAGIPARHTR